MLICEALFPQIRAPFSHVPQYRASKQKFTGNVEFATKKCENYFKFKKWEKLNLTPKQ